MPVLESRGPGPPAGFLRESRVGGLSFEYMAAKLILLDVGANHPAHSPFTTSRGGKWGVLSYFPGEES